MELLSVNDKCAVLGKLFSRITGIAKAMGGNPSDQVLALTIPSAMTAEFRSENAPALWVEMPNSFQVEFAPSIPLSIGSALSVRAKRTHDGGRKRDWTFTYWPDGWRTAQTPLSDAEIEACLTPEGPPPLY